MKVYKIRHKPSGLFFQPSRGHGNLSLKGKIYTSQPSLKWVETLTIDLWESNSKLSKTIIEHFNPPRPYPGRRRGYVKTNIEDWEIIEL